ncbi:ATP-dependent RNA helicase RhlB [Tamilnaduibacter salinus]|uniref:ATP-dependent RNA helicase RhlB n=1 Tax=Tamilnaduibacter salinus TaxID=1484056 RepID=A0A2A2I6N7_9GAMM|nr:ATP-dependent RNA helicase RhlB [Tamilnaduibacter salinus]
MSGSSESDGEQGNGTDGRTAGPTEADSGEEAAENEERPTRFEDLALAPPLQKALAGIGFTTCTPIQAETLPMTLAGHDLIGQAQTGTGKTAAFLLTAIQRMLATPLPWEERYASEPRILALAPTRELAMQIAEDAEQLCAHTGHSVMTVMGGVNYDRQREQLRNEALDILVATPGRLIDFLSSQDVFLDQIDMLIIDEADRMLDMGFIPDVKRIIRKCTPKDQRQTLLFSATFNQDVLNLSSMWTRKAEFVEIEPEQKTAERVDQSVFMVGNDDKLTVLTNYLKRPEVEKAIIFANRRDQCRDLNDDLRNQGIASELMSGEIAQNKRLKTLDRFREGQIQALVATDVAGRGIHVNGVTHVFNYNLPDNAEDYVHRIGRTGRAGRNGVSVSFASEDDAFSLPAIEAYIDQKLTCEVPEESLTQPLKKPPIQRRKRRGGGGGRRPQGRRR